MKKGRRKALRGRRPVRAPPSAASSEAIKPSRLGGHAALVGREPCSYPASYSRLHNDPAKLSGVCTRPRRRALRHNMPCSVWGRSGHRRPMLASSTPFSSSIAGSQASNSFQKCHGPRPIAGWTTTYHISLSTAKSRCGKWRWLARQQYSKHGDAGGSPASPSPAVSLRLLQARS